MPTFLYFSAMLKDKKRAQKWSRYIWRIFFSGNNKAKFFTLLVSVFLWFLIKLSKEDYQHTLHFPVTFTNTPDHLRLTNKPAKEVRLVLNGQGFAILKHNLFTSKKIEIDLSRLNSLPNGRYYWSAQKGLSEVDAQFTGPVQILKMEPDTLFFNFTEVIAKKVPVKAAIKVSSNLFALQENKLEIQPDSVTLRAPASILDTLHHITTSPYEIKEKRDSLTRQLSLNIPHPDVHSNVSKVQAFMYFENLTQGSFTIPISVRQVPDSVHFEIFPREAQVSYHVPLSRFGAVQSAAFTLSVNYNQLQKTEEQEFLTIQLQSKPNMVSRVSIKPKRVEYIITRKL